MLGLLNPKQVAARKIARLIAEGQSARGATAERATRAEAPPEAEKGYDSLESLLDRELRKYGMSLG